MGHQTSMSSLRLAECHPGDGPGMKPIFDGVYINQILLQAQVPSASYAATCPAPSPFATLSLPPSHAALPTEQSFKPGQKGGQYLLDGF